MIELDALDAYPDATTPSRAASASSSPTSANNHPATPPSRSKRRPTVNQTLDSRPVQIGMVTSAHGLDSSQYTFSYVAGLALDAVTDSRELADILRSTGQRVIGATDSSTQSLSVSSGGLVVRGRVVRAGWCGCRTWCWRGVAPSPLRGRARRAPGSSAPHAAR